MKANDEIAEGHSMNDKSLVGRYFLSQDRVAWGRIAAEAGPGIYLIEQDAPYSGQHLTNAVEMHRGEWRFFDTADLMQEGRAKWCGRCGGHRWESETIPGTEDHPFPRRVNRESANWGRAHGDIRYRTDDGTPNGRPCSKCHIHNGVVASSTPCRICATAPKERQA